MLDKIAKFIKKSFFILSMSDSDKMEFTKYITSINISRVKITTMTFIVLEALMLLIHLIRNSGKLFDTPYIYYGSMYTAMLVLMVIFLAIFTKMAADVPKNLSRIIATGNVFIFFILAWCGGISLLDQFSNGQVIVYIMAVVSIAITPYFEPGSLFIIYLIVHVLFIAALPYFQNSTRVLFANIINSSTFVLMSWAISYMRYKNQVEVFINNKIILQKNDELRAVNIQLQEANRRLEIMSMTDGLTGVINRLSFENMLREEWDRCKRHKIPLSLIMVDIDYFKEYNDNYGHQAGDFCVKLVADVLSSCAKRSSDKVGRYGGDEFLVLLPHTDNDGAFHLAEQMRKEVEQNSVAHLYSAVSDRITISLGVNTTIPSDESSVDEFINNTDKALYIAKKNRNCSVATQQ